jgi:hypothetical protein
MSAGKGWNNATSRMTNHMMMWLSNQIGLNFPNCLASQMPGLTAAVYMR